MSDEQYFLSLWKSVCRPRKNWFCVFLLELAFAIRGSPGSSGQDCRRRYYWSQDSAPVPRSRSVSFLNKPPTVLNEKRSQLPFLNMTVHFKTAKQDWVFSFPLSSTFKRVCEGIRKQIEERGDGQWQVTDFMLPGRDTLSPPGDPKTLKQAGLKDGDTVSVSLEPVPIMKRGTKPPKKLTKKERQFQAKIKQFKAKIMANRDWFLQKWKSELTNWTWLFREVYNRFDELAEALELDEETTAYLSEKMKEVKNECDK